VTPNASRIDDFCLNGLEINRLKNLAGTFAVRGRSILEIVVVAAVKWRAKQSSGDKAKNSHFQFAMFHFRTPLYFEAVTLLFIR
jgi:hypothetical protein